MGSPWRVVQAVSELGSGEGKQKSTTKEKAQGALMITQANTTYSKLDALTRQANRHFSRLLNRLDETSKLRRKLDDLSDFIQRLALGTDEFNLATARINNARRYIDSQEFGAAKYEIRLLIGGLRHRLPDDQPQKIAKT